VIHYGKVFSVTTLIVVLDQLTKYWAELYLSSGRPITIIPGLFDLTLVYNPGAAFGMFSGLPDGIRQKVLWSVSCVGVGVVFWFLAREARHDFVAQLALGAVLGGAFGNIIDRYRYGKVVDFLDFYIGSMHWPAFNVADSAITVGVTIILLRLVLFQQIPKAESDGAMPGA
jgi:signal peptidase II